MVDVTNPSHDSFPKNDLLYRIFWAGEVLLPKPATLTPRIRIWLKETDEYGVDVPGRPAVEVTESAGAIPRLPIGSYWRNGSRTRPRKANPDRSEFLEIEAPSRWTPVKAGDDHSWFRQNPRNSRRHCWINRYDLPLSFSTSHGRQVHGHHAWVVPARTTSGQEVILPSYEVFRALLANTTDLSLALLGNTWDNMATKFLLGKKETDGPEGRSWHIDLAPRVPHSAVPYLAWLTFVEDAVRAANAVYPALIHQGSILHPVWISAVPPVLGKRFRIRARTVELASRNALLVTQILEFEAPIRPATLSYSVPVETFPVGDLTAGESEPKEVDRPSKKTANVTKPDDRRPNQRLFELPSMAVKWCGLPFAKRIAREKRPVPIPNVAVKITAPQPISVSVGEPGSRRAPSPARFTPQEEREIENRFQAIRDLVDELAAEGIIQSAIEYPLVRPAPAESPIFCEFPMERNGKEWSWSIIRWPTRRARLALVLEIQVDSRFVYWIETETISRQHHSLAVEMISRDPLDEGNLAALLDICAYANGVWPEELPYGRDSILATRARHIYHGDRLAPNTMSLAFARLARQRAQRGDAKEADSSVVEINALEGSTH